MFKFGASFGALRLGLTAADIPFEAFTPQRGQKGLGIPPRKKHDKTRTVRISKGKNKGRWRSERCGGETSSDFKKRLRSHAQKLFPKIKVTKDTADALLIAEFCRRYREGKL